MTERDPEQPRYGAANASRADQIARLRTRIKHWGKTPERGYGELRGILQGILDLIADDGGGE